MDELTVCLTDGTFDVSLAVESKTHEFADALVDLWEGLDGVCRPLRRNVGHRKHCGPPRTDGGRTLTRMALVGYRRRRTRSMLALASESASSPSSRTLLPLAPCRFSRELCFPFRIPTRGHRVHPSRSSSDPRTSRSNRGVDGAPTGGSRCTPAGESGTSRRSDS